MQQRKQPQFMDAVEVASLLRVSLATIRAWTMHRRLPVVKVGRRVLFRRDRIEAWLAAREVPPQND